MEENLMLGNTASKAESAHAALLHELETVRAQLGIEQGNVAGLRTELDNAQTQLTTLLTTLTQTQQDLEVSQQANADQATSHRTEVSMLRERIKELEAQLSLPFSKRLKIRARRIAKRFGDLIGVPGETKLVSSVVKRGKPLEVSLE